MTTGQSIVSNKPRKLDVDDSFDSEISEEIPEDPPEPPDENPINFKKVLQFFEDSIKYQKLQSKKDEDDEVKEGIVCNDVNDDIDSKQDSLSHDQKQNDEDKPEGDERKNEDVNNNEADQEDKEKGDRNEEEDENKEEEEDTEMTEEEKEEMYNAVCAGDEAWLQNCLDKPNADINMKWFGENLLLLAMRIGQFRMAEFLIDIGIDVNFEIDLIDVQHKEKTGTRFQCYRKSCRQYAYENGLEYMVELIDLRNNNWFKFAKKTPRKPFSRRPFPPPVPEVPGEEEEEEEELEGIIDEYIESVSVAGKSVKDSSRSKEKHSARSKTTDSGNVSGKLEVTCDELSSCSSDSSNKRRERFDDGYESMSSPYHSFAAAGDGQKERPGLLTRGTKASLSIKKHTNQIMGQRQYSKSAKSYSSEKVKTVGSYARESRLWQPIISQDDVEEPVPYFEKTFNISKTRPSESRFKIRSQSAALSQNERLLDRNRHLNRQRPLSTPASALSQVSKILGECRLLRPQVDQVFPYINPTHQMSPSYGKIKLNPWCHGNSSGVYTKLSDAKIKNSIKDTKFSVNKQLYERTERPYSHKLFRS